VHRLATRAGFRCEYCDADVLASVNAVYSCTTDHIVPHKSGRSTHDLENLAVSCTACNTLKWGWTPPGDYRATRIASVRAYLTELRERKEPVLLRGRQRLRPEQGGGDGTMA